MAKRVGSYELGLVLGKGSFSTVREGIDVKRGGARRAVKCIEKSKVKGPVASALRREITTMQGMCHERVVQLFDVVQSASNIYVVLEHVDGGDLFDVMMQQENRRFAPDVASRYFKQLVAGLTYLHGEGIAHRDVKLENLLLRTSDDSIVIGDFGLCFASTTSAPLVTVCGTPNYMAPEVITSTTGYCGYKYDVWSAGICLYTMLVGSLPFDHRDQLKLMDLIVSGSYRMPSSLPRDAADLLKSILVVDPAVRATLKEVCIVLYTVLCCWVYFYCYCRLCTRTTTTTTTTKVTSHDFLWQCPPTITKAVSECGDDDEDVPTLLCSVVPGLLTCENWSFSRDVGVSQVSSTDDMSKSQGTDGGANSNSSISGLPEPHDEDLCDQDADVDDPVVLNALKILRSRTSSRDSLSCS